jgi:hypothetical protein
MVPTVLAATIDFSDFISMSFVISTVFVKNYAVPVLAQHPQRARPKRQ